MADVKTSQYSYAAGGATYKDAKPACTQGAEVGSPSSITSYLSGRGAGSATSSAYLSGTSSLVRASVYAYIGQSVVRASLSVYMGGEDVELPYIVFTASDDSVSKKFRVIAQDYDDGTPERAEQMERTIGGGVDHSVGAVYRSWSPIIRVRQTEDAAGIAADYGTLADLEWFYALNNPNGTPSNNITFTDHHNVEYTVHIVGKMPKSVMGVRTVGTEAWYLVKVNLVMMQ